MDEIIQFQAEFVEINLQEYTSDFKVIGIFFGEGDVERGGQYWNFTRSMGDEEDEGVCTVKEIQQVTIYDGIDRFSIDRQKVVCIFSQQ